MGKQILDILAPATLLALLLAGCYAEDEGIDAVVQARLDAIAVVVTPNPVAVGDSVHFQGTYRGSPTGGYQWEVEGKMVYGNNIRIQAPTTPGTHEYVVWYVMPNRGGLKKPFHVTVVP